MYLRRPYGIASNTGFMLLAIGRSREDGALTCLLRVTGSGGKRVIRTEPPRHAVRKQRGDHSLEISNSESARNAARVRGAVSVRVRLVA